MQLPSLKKATISCVSRCWSSTLSLRVTSGGFLLGGLCGRGTTASSRPTRHRVEVVVHTNTATRTHAPCSRFFSFSFLHLSFFLISLNRSMFAHRVSIRASSNTFVPIQQRFVGFAFLGELHVLLF
jgi:hypothetical protein